MSPKAEDLDKYDEQEINRREKRRKLVNSLATLFIIIILIGFALALYSLK